jgi:Zn-dependent protease with chaperone function
MSFWTAAADTINPPQIGQIGPTAAGDTASLQMAADNPEQITYPLSPERKKLLNDYSHFKNIWRFVWFLIDIIILGAIVFTGFSARIRNWAEKISARKLSRYFFYFLFFTVITFLVYLPFKYFRGFFIEHKYGFSNMTLGQWLMDSLKSEVITLILGFMIIWILYWLINSFKKWWLVFTLGSIPFAVLVVAVAPVLIDPLYNKFEPLQDQQLAAEMHNLANQAGISNPDIFQVDASRQSNYINAYFTGMFGTKRIVLNDNIIGAMTHDELRFVMGHEIGHYMMNHIWKGMWIAVALILIAAYLINLILPRIIDRFRHRIGFDHLGDIASLPLLLLMISIFAFFIQPAHNGVSRYMEYNADEYGWRLSEVSIATAATAFDKLSVYNLSDPSPPGIIEFWFYDHPSLDKRIGRLKKLSHAMDNSP